MLTHHPLSQMHLNSPHMQALRHPSQARSSSCLEGEARPEIYISHAAFYNSQ